MRSDLRVFEITPQPFAGLELGRGQHRLSLAVAPGAQPCQRALRGVDGDHGTRPIRIGDTALRARLVLPLIRVLGSDQASVPRQTGMAQMSAAGAVLVNPVPFNERSEQFRTNRAHRFMEFIAPDEHAPPTVRTEMGRQAAQMGFRLGEPPKHPPGFAFDLPFRHHHARTRLCEYARCGTRMQVSVRPQANRRLQIIQGGIQRRRIPAILDKTARMRDRGAVAVETAADVGIGQSERHVRQIHRHLAGERHASASARWRPKLRLTDPKRDGNGGLDKTALRHCLPADMARHESRCRTVSGICGFAGMIRKP